MRHTPFKTALATIAFALVHSALASRTAKDATSRALGPQARNGWYRVFYLVQSAVTLGLLGSYLRRLPTREVYRAPKWAAWLMHAGQAAALAYAVWAAREVSIPGMLGVTSLSAWLHGEPAPPEPAAQGPALDETGAMRATGPFAWSRHPLNLVPVVIFWLWPRMTTKLLTFNIVSTAYLILGSVHEETRLRAAYGDAYEDYQQSGVPFYLPCPFQGQGDETS